MNSYKWCSPKKVYSEVSPVLSIRADSWASALRIDIQVSHVKLASAQLLVYLKFIKHKLDSMIQMSVCRVSVMPA